jgi:polynucleotide 5'-hydroxyl-kinase GRC3/NOL9
MTDFNRPKDNNSVFRIPFALHDTAIQIGWKYPENEEFSIASSESFTSSNSQRILEDEQDVEAEVLWNDGNINMEGEKVDDGVTIQSDQDVELNAYDIVGRPDIKGENMQGDLAYVMETNPVENNGEECDHDGTIRIGPGVTLARIITNMATEQRSTAPTVELALQGWEAAVTIYGRYEVHVIEGRIDVLGYLMTPKSSVITVESPRWLSAIVIRNYTGTTSRMVVRNLFPYSSENMSRKEKSSSSTRGRKRSTIGATDDEDDNEQHYCDNNLEIIPPSMTRTTIQIPKNWELAIQCCLQDLARRKRGGLTIAESRDEDDIVWMCQDDMVESNQCHPILPPLKILLCGAKGVGKSTLLRYTIHRILSEGNDETHSNRGGTSTSCCDAVAVLDCDLGQPEFSPPGIVSLTMVSQPILTPPHCHMMYGHEKYSYSTCTGSTHDPSCFQNTTTTHDNVHKTNYCERSYYFGHPTSKADPKTYLLYLSNLMEAYQKIISNSTTNNQWVPLIVNCDGWVKSMGRDILCTIIHDIVKPDHIIQIVGPTKSTSFELPTITTTHTDDKEKQNGATGSNPQVHILEIFGSQDNPTRAPLQSTQRNRPLFAPSVRPRDLRALRLCTYFVGGSSVLSLLGIQFTSYAADRLIDPWSSSIIATYLASMIPYRVPFDAISCHIIGNAAGKDTRISTHYTDDMIFDCMDGTIVGLGMEERLDDIDPILMRLHSCAGLGIVRSIDRIKRILYILTPIPFSQLQKVTSLFVGGGQCELPLECLVPTEISESFPFLAASAVSVDIT